MTRDLPRRSFAFALALAACVLLLGAGSALGASARLALSCSARGLAAGAATPGSAVRVVALQATGISCPAARRMALRVAVDILHGASLSFPNASGLSVNEESCGGCPSRTEVAISYARSRLQVSLVRPAAPEGAGAPGVITA